MSLKRLILTCFAFCATILSTMASPAYGVNVITDTTVYAPGEIALIQGSGFAAGESVLLRIRGQLGGPTQYQNPTVDGAGRFLVQNPVGYLYADGETVNVDATGAQSGLQANTSFMASVKVNLDQLQNGIGATPSSWSNGNINGSNSCYAEDNAVPFRYFIEGLESGEDHFFTISMEWTKGGIHAYDYITEYYLSEAGPIASAGGECGTISTTPPSDCDSPTVSYVLPTPADSANYSSIPTGVDFYDPGFAISGPLKLWMYNATVDSVGKYFFAGTASDRTLNFKVYFTVSTTASVGFFWGGHLASGNAGTWGSGMGAASVAGAPYHMRAVDFDGGGGKNQDRSIQNGVICLPPAVNIACAASELICGQTSSSCTETSSANKWTWTVTGGNITSGQGTNTINYTATSSSVHISVEACDTTSGCAGDFCCATDSVIIPVTPNSPPVCTVPSDTSIVQCSPGQICLPGFSCYDADGNLVSTTVNVGTLSAGTVCFTPINGLNVIELTCTDACGAVSKCSTVVSVLINTPPVVTCPPDDSLLVCNLSSICLEGFSVADPDGNVDSCWTSTGTLSGDSVCFTPVNGQNVIWLYCMDVCGNQGLDSCVLTVYTGLNSPPVASCPAPIDTFVCDLSEICVPGFSYTDVDGNLVTTSVSLGTLNQGTVCFTPTPGLNQIILSTKDACDEVSVCTTYVDVSLNAAPVCSVPSDTSIFLCAPAQICLPGFGCTDADGNLVSTTVNLGTLTAGTVCFDPVEGVNTIVLTCTDACGASSVCSTQVTVGFNDAPVCQTPADTSIFQCTPAEICLPGFGCSDANGNLVSSTVNVGTLNAGVVCFSPVEGINTIVLTCTDACGAQSICSTQVTVGVNHPPVCDVPPDTTIFQCTPSTICLSGFGCADSDGNLVSSTVNVGTLIGGAVCFSPVEGLNNIVLTCTDVCGAQSICTTQVTVQFNDAPACLVPPDTSLFQCTPTEICLPGFGCTDANGNLVSSTVNVGTLTAGTVCFMPVAGANPIVLTCTDACGAQSVCTTQVTVTINQAPTCMVPADTTILQCTPGGQICLPGFSCFDPDGNLVSSTVNVGTLSAGTVCFVPVNGLNTIELTCTDACGAVSRCTTQVMVTINAPPVVTCPPDDSLLVCDLSPICLEGFAVADPNGNLDSCWTSKGTLQGDSVCFTPVNGKNVIWLYCMDACGNQGLDSCVLMVFADLNTPPDPSCPPPVDTFVCDLSPICLSGFECADVNDNVVTSSVNVGTLDQGTVCFTPVPGLNRIIFTCRDACDAVGVCTTTVNVRTNRPPVASCPPSFDTLVCDPEGSICIGPFECSDADGNGISSVIEGGSLQGDSVCFVPVEGPNEIRLICRDACGAEDTCVTTVNVRFGPRICIDTLTAAPNSLAQVCLKVETGGKPWGGFDFLLAFDPSLLTFVGADPGQFLIDCDWEYFTYRVLPGTPGSLSAGKVRLVAIADMNNSNDHPYCLIPDSGDVIACLTFKVTGDWSLSCRDALIQWLWADCGDNSISNPLGDTLFIASPAAGSIVNWEGTDLTGLPSLGGPPLPCPADKGEPDPCTRFCGGKIKIICPGEIDDRGDMNLNSIAYEIADAVLYSRYFISGPSVFTVNALGQIAASDVNADGVALTVADLVYLIRVITGDELPIQESLLGGGPKVALPVGSVTIQTEQHGMHTSVSTSSEFDLGAALFVFSTEGAAISRVETASRARGMNVDYQVHGDQLRVLLYSIEDRAKIAAGSGEVLNITSTSEATIELVTVEAATFGGEALTTEFSAGVLPMQFALHANRPNPFNPSTSFNVDFPMATDYTIVIYNIAGQAVRSLTGSAQAGTSTFHWDGRSESGAAVASGVYFYQISAGPYHDIRKMVLMK